MSSPVVVDFLSHSTYNTVYVYTHEDSNFKTRSACARTYLFFLFPKGGKIGMIHHENGGVRKFIQRGVIFTSRVVGQYHLHFKHIKITKRGEQPKGSTKPLSYPLTRAIATITLHYKVPRANPITKSNFSKVNDTRTRYIHIGPRDIYIPISTVKLRNPIAPVTPTEYLYTSDIKCLICTRAQTSSALIIYTRRGGKVSIFVAIYACAPTRARSLHSEFS